MGPLAFDCAPWLSVMGGLRWDSLYVFMANPTTIPGFSSVSDESDLTISAIEPYLGFEAAWVGRRCALTLKGIGSPWVSTRTIFGMTFGRSYRSGPHDQREYGHGFKAGGFSGTLSAIVSPDVMPVHRWSICNRELRCGPTLRATSNSTRWLITDFDSDI